MKERAWIESIDEDRADGLLGEVYGKCHDATLGGVANILKVHSLKPQLLSDHVRFYRDLMYSPSGLSRAEREMIGVVVSGINGCHY